MRKHIILRLCLMVFATFFVTLSYAQERVITGVVTNQEGSPLSSASIGIKGKKAVTLTDEKGTFRFNVSPADKFLVVSYVGMKSVEIPIDQKTNYIITLDLEASSLDDVVVIGYGQKRRADINSSISSVGERDIKNLPVAGVDLALQGKVAGVTVTSNGGQPGGGVSVRIRGITSVNGNEPLYVVDGVPILTSTSSISYDMLGGGAGQNSNSVLATLNPNDIESIDILKDASAQAIYGSLGANGVVLITTKKGKMGEGKINYDVFVGTANVPKRLDIMDLKQYAKYSSEVMSENNQTPPGEFAFPDYLGKGTDWQDEIFQTGITQNHQLSFSGGQNKTTYYFSGNYYDQTGIIIGSAFKRYSMRMNIDQQVKSWFKAGVSINATRSNQKLTLADEHDGTVSVGLIQSPAIPVRNLDGSWGGPTTIGNIQFFQDNPVAKAMLRQVNSQQTKVFGNIYGDLQISKKINFRNELGYDFQLTNNMAFQPTYVIGTTVNSQSTLLENRNNSFFWVFKSYLNYNDVFADVHRIDFTAGHEAWQSNYDFIQGQRYNLVTNGLIALNAGDAENQNLSGGKGHAANESYFGRLSYTYDDKYSITGTIRRDGSSNFGPQNRWGTFPSVSVGWTVSNEAFMANSKIDYLKLRVGYGIVGNQNQPAGAASPPFASNVRIMQTGFGMGSFLRNIGRADLGWESVISSNAGIDISFLQNRLTINLDVYQKITSDMLLFSSAPRFTGLGTNWNDVLAPVVNAGKMTNTGVDLAINAHIVKKKDFNWNSTLIFSHYKNELNELINENSSIDGRVEYATVLVTHTVPGAQVGQFYGLKTNGIFRTMEDLNRAPIQFGQTVSQSGTWLGDVLYQDLNNDGVIDANDMTAIGSPHPKFTYGFTNNFSYKNFDVTLFLQGSHGAKILNYLRRSTESLNNFYFNQLTTAFDRWTPDNPNSDIPRFTQSNPNNRAVSDRFIEDGSYLRIQTLSIGYQLPESLTRKVFIQRARVYLAAQNLYTFTKYSGFDPELGAFNKSITLMNVDNGKYPNPRTITIGANIEF
jgi:TonB-linked SusC/RagA family outer membrane protein